MMEKSFDTEWEAIHSTQEWGSYPSETVIRFIARNYYKKNRAEVKVLDFGCGAGAHAWYLAREGFDTYAFDGSKSAIERAEKRLTKENLKAHFQVADALELDYPDNYFDAVVDSACIYANRIKNIEFMYQEIYNMLKLGGKLLTICFGTKTAYETGEKLEEDTYRKLVGGVLEGRGTTHFFTKESLEAVLKKAQFQDIQIDSIMWTDNGRQVEQYVAVAVK